MDFAAGVDLSEAPLPSYDPIPPPYNILLWFLYS